MVFRAKQRFIAGAVCPKCAVMDKLVVFKENSKTFRECVGCGYKEEMQFSSQFKPLPTRVDVTKEKTDREQRNIEQDVVKIITLDRKD